MTRYILGGLAAAALALTGCNSNNKAGTGYSGTQPNRNDTQYQQGYDTNSNYRQTGQGSDNSFSGVSGNGDVQHSNDYNNEGYGRSGTQKSDKDMATGRDLKDKEQNPANLPATQTMSITGTVKDAGHGQLTLVTGSKGEIKLNTGDYTTITGANGMMIKSHDIKEGSEVRAAYTFDGKDNKATSIVVTKTPVTNAEQKGTFNNTDDKKGYK